ncbi:hypothetical protein DL769_006119 [Monosporascus sp. CRB-8-3]|nr:hypothetical protein DL769_006119 [Monosporascus sp. CRB-8-3]
MSSHTAPLPSTGLMPSGVDTDTRPRNRRVASNYQLANSPNLTPGQTPASSRGVSPIPSRLANNNLSSSGRSSPSNTFSRGLLEGSWAPNWSSVQEFATSLLSGSDTGYASESSRPGSRSGGRATPRSLWKGLGDNSTSRKSSDAWGPPPPPKPRPTAQDIAAGSLKEREAQLIARKRASVLESYDGVNGGLDVGGKFKRRNSDEIQHGTPSELVAEEHLCYLHHVQPTDTYAGIVLRYRCQEHAFRKANGLWSQNNIQIRKHLLIPVDACEVKGRPCDPPSYYSNQVDHLAPTSQGPDPTSRGASPRPQQPLHDDYFSPVNGKSAESKEDEGQPWTHVKWVKIDSIPNPVEIVRVDRKAMGYFPPRRKKSVNTVSGFSTPRQSSDLSRVITNTSEAVESPGRLSSRRQSSASARPSIAGSATLSSSRGRGNSLGELDGVPAWMRRPGGVGTMGKSVHAPGPAKDYFNSWVNKRLPKGFNIDSLPSMSVMGSKSAHFGFSKDEPSAIVESPFEEGRDASVANARGGTGGGGLEQAAASIETWLRGAWAKRPATPRKGSSHLRRTTAHHQQQHPEDSDLIELADTNSDDGWMCGGGGGVPESGGFVAQSLHGSTARSDGAGSVRGRSTGPAASKGKKAD